MPDKRKHRGQHPEDGQLFNIKTLPVLRKAVGDYSLLLSRGYAVKSTLKLVGDRYRLTERQRIAVMRAGCSDQQLYTRQDKQLSLDQAADRPILIDGYNLLITVESVLSGGVLLKCRDGCIRDLASIHGTYRQVLETIPAFECIAECARQNQLSPLKFLFDRPVSNSARLKQLIESKIKEHYWNWTIELSQNPDADLIKSEQIIITSDSRVLDNCRHWINPIPTIIEQILSDGQSVNLYRLYEGR